MRLARYRNARKAEADARTARHAPWAIPLPRTRSPPASQRAVPAGAPRTRGSSPHGQRSAASTLVGPRDKRSLLVGPLSRSYRVGSASSASRTTLRGVAFDALARVGGVPWRRSASMPRTSRSRPACLLGAVSRGGGGRLRARPCRRTTSRRGASARASRASPGRGSAPRWQTTSLPFGVVNAPGQRYHPAIVAQATATLAEMFPGRLWVALGTGEASNEHITGEPWPRKAVAQRPAARVRRRHPRAVRGRGGRPTTASCTVDRARLWTLPAEPPPLLGAGGDARRRPRLAGELGGRADHDQPAARTQLERVLAAFRERGGEGKPVALQVHLSWAPNDDEALRDRARPVAHQRLRAAAVAGTWRRSSSSTSAARTCGPRTCAARCSSRRDLGAPRRVDRRARRARVRRASTSTTSARSSGRSSTPSASTCSPR